MTEDVTPDPETIDSPEANHSPALIRFSTGPEQPRLRMRQRLARLGATKTPQSAVLDPLFKIIRSNHPKADLPLIQRAYQTAEHYHRGQVRKSGDPYITHPLAVTTILAELGMTEPTLCAALLHDTVEDTSYTIEQLRADFGEEITVLVDGVTKLDKVTYGSSAKAETIRKLIIAMSKDIRVLVIKLADRLHNMRTLGFLTPEKQQRIANDTLQIFAPLAHRLGMNQIKWELEDLAFAITEPRIYNQIVKLVAEYAPRRERYLKEIITEVQQVLDNAKIKATVYGRPKHYYSIYQKMLVRGREFAEIYDLVGLRVLVNTPRDCYAVLGEAHRYWKPLPGRFKDYIAMPKFNMYQSLHTTVLGFDNRPVELQIRTFEMHRRAEYGVAAHWKYKMASNPGGEGKPLSWVNSLSQISREDEDPSDFLESVLFEIQSDEVYVFTPKGEVFALPAGATPIDLAFAVHTEVGYRCIGARVNGRLVPLDSQLSTGDTVEALTSKAETAGPSRDWLSFVVSPRARTKIKQYFTRERRDEAIEQGKDALAKQLRRAGLPLQRILTIECLTSVANSLRVSNVPALYAAIGQGHISAQSVVAKMASLAGDIVPDDLEDRPIFRPISRKIPTESGVVVEGDPSIYTKLARCCTPLPGDNIIGFVTKTGGVSVHRKDCTNAAALLSQPERLVEVQWAQEQESAFLVTIQVEGLDRAGLITEVSKAVTDEHINIKSINIVTSKNHTFKGRISFESPDPKHLQHVINIILRIPGIYEAFRVSS